MKKEESQKDGYYLDYSYDIQDYDVYIEGQEILSEIKKTSMEIH